MQEDVAVKSSVEDVYIFRCTRPLFDWNYLLVDEGDAKKILLYSFQWKTKKKECSWLCNGGRRFFTVGGAPPWYSNRSPSKRTITEAYPLKDMDRFPSFAVNLDEDPTDIFGAVCALLVCSALLKNCNNY